MTPAENECNRFVLHDFSAKFLSNHFGKSKLKFKPFPLELLLNIVSAIKEFVKQNFRGKDKYGKFHEVLQKLTLQDFKKLPLLYGKF